MLHKTMNWYLYKRNKEDKKELLEIKIIMADMKNSQEEFEDKIEEILRKLRTGQRNGK